MLRLLFGKDPGTGTCTLGMRMVEPDCYNVDENILLFGLLRCGLDLGWTFSTWDLKSPIFQNVWNCFLFYVLKVWPIENKNRSKQKCVIHTGEGRAPWRPWRISADGVYSSARSSFSLFLPRTLSIDVSLWLKTTNDPNGEIAFLRSKKGCRLGWQNKPGMYRATYPRSREERKTTLDFVKPNIHVSGASKNMDLLFFFLVNFKWPFLYF